MEKNNILLNEILEFINKTIKYIPVLSFLFLFFSSAELYSYYKYFNINIYNYITIEDVFFEFYSVFFEYISRLLVTIFIILIFYHYYGYDTKKRIETKWLMMILGSVALVLLLIDEFTNIKISNIYFEIICSIPYALIYLNVINNIHDNKIKILLAFLFIFGYLCIKVNYLSKINAKEIIENNQSIEVKFDYLNKQITSNLENTYIGETSNYMFFYCKSKSQTAVYKKDDIQNLTFTKR